VTIDQHEWYAPPQLYTRNDATGLWTAKPAIPPESPFLASAHHANHVDTNSNSVPSLSESSPMDLKCQYDSENLTDGCIKMQTDDEIVVDGSHSSEDSLVEKKRRRVDEEIAAEGTLPSYGDLEDVQGDLLRHPSNGEGSDLARTISSNASLAEQVIEPALVMFEVHVPPVCMLDGVHSQHFFGTGVIIHHSDCLGLVAVDRNTVAVSISDIMLSFAAYPIEIPGEVVFLHPVHNFALVAYDPSALGAGASVVRAAKLLPEPALRRGDSVYLVGLSRSLQATSRKSIITNPCTAVNIGSADCPRYRAINMEVIELDTGTSYRTFTALDHV
jgi:hypothetical protein